MKILIEALVLIALVIIFAKWFNTPEKLKDEVPVTGLKNKAEVVKQNVEALKNELGSIEKEASESKDILNNINKENPNTKKDE